MDNYVEPYDPDTDVRPHITNFFDELADLFTPPPQPEPPLQLGGVGRTALARQRERTRRMQLQDLVNYFHLSQLEAAKQLDMSPKALQKICRRNGLHRWPSRKIQAIDRRIEEMEREMRSNNSWNYELEIQAARLERVQIYESVLAATNNY